MLQGLAQVERRLGSWEASVGHFRDALALDPRNPAIQYDLGFSLALMKRVGEARPFLEGAVRSGPTNQSGHEALFGALLWAAGDSAAAREHSERTQLEDPSVVAKWRSDLAIVRRDFAAAAAALDGLPEEEPDDSPFTGYAPYHPRPLPLLRARAAWLQRDAAALDRHAAEILRWADASRFSRPGFDPWRHTRDVHLMRALAYAYRGDVEAARAEAELVPVDLGRDAADDTTILNSLTLVWIVLGEKERALEGLERLAAVPSPVTATRLRLDPTYDSLRGEPRFQGLVARGGG